MNNSKFQIDVTTKTLTLIILEIKVLSSDGCEPVGNLKQIISCPEIKNAILEYIQNEEFNG